MNTLITMKNCVTSIENETSNSPRKNMRYMCAAESPHEDNSMKFSTKFQTNFTQPNSSSDRCYLQLPDTAHRTIKTKPETV